MFRRKIFQCNKLKIFTFSITISVFRRNILRRKSVKRKVTLYTKSLQKISRIFNTFASCSVTGKTKPSPLRLHPPRGAVSSGFPRPSALKSVFPGSIESWRTQKKASSPPAPPPATQASPASAASPKSWTTCSTCPPKNVVALVQMRRKGLQLLRSRIGDDRMEYRENGSFELISEAEAPALEQLEKIKRAAVRYPARPRLFNGGS